jgi:hypothetical protein
VNGIDTFEFYNGQIETVYRDTNERDIKYPDGTSKQIFQDGHVKRKIFFSE